MAGLSSCVERSGPAVCPATDTKTQQRWQCPKMCLGEKWEENCPDNGGARLVYAEG